MRWIWFGRDLKAQSHSIPLAWAGTFFIMPGDLTRPTLVIVFYILTYILKNAGWSKCLTLKKKSVVKMMVSEGLGAFLVALQISLFCLVCFILH